MSKPKNQLLHGIVLAIAGLLLWMYGCAGVTPASIFVSGYYRSDGTYVHSYYRRPPGSVSHDQPFEAAEWLGFFAVCGGIYLIRTRHRTISPQITPVQRSFPQVGRTPPCPANEPIDRGPVPTNCFVADAKWSCDICERPFTDGTEFWAHESALGVSTPHYCTECRDQWIRNDRRRAYLIGRQRGRPIKRKL
jgi:hypothetical protein